jgi:hypothetical protein
MNLFIDNNDGRGQRDYTSYVDTDHLPKIARKLNAPASMIVDLVAAIPSFYAPVKGARVILQRSDGYTLFTGYLAMPPTMQYLGYGQIPAWRYTLTAIDDSLLLDHNELPERTVCATRTAADALTTLANDVLPGVLDESGVQDNTPVNQFVIVPQKGWTWHAQELSLMARSAYRAHDGKLDFQPVGQQSFTISEQDPNFDPTGLTLLQPAKLLNDVTIVGELEPLTYVRDYFLGNGTTLSFYLSETPFGNTAVASSNYGYAEPQDPPTLWSLIDPNGRVFTVFADDYSEAQLLPTLWSVTDPNGTVSLASGQLQLNGGPSTITYVEQVELAGGWLMQHGNFVFNAASTGTVGGIYSGSPSDANCIAGFVISPNGSNSNIQAIVNGSVTGPVLTTTAGQQYAFTTELICIEAHRVNQTFLSSLHPAGNGRGGDAIPASVRVVLTVHDVDPNNPETLATVATVLYDSVLPTPPGFATYAVINSTSLFVGVSYTSLQRMVNAEIRSMIPNGQFRTRLSSSFAAGGECYRNRLSRLSSPIAPAAARPRAYRIRSASRNTPKAATRASVSKFVAFIFPSR